MLARLVHRRRLTTAHPPRLLRRQQRVVILDGGADGVAARRIVHRLDVLLERAANEGMLIGFSLGERRRAHPEPLLDDRPRLWIGFPAEYRLAIALCQRLARASFDRGGSRGAAFLLCKSRHFAFCHGLRALLANVTIVRVDR